MTNELPPLPYIICFCIQDCDVLMLHRNKRPNADRDNGLGGKRDGGKASEIFNEDPNITNLREVKEESGIDLKQAELVRFAGILSWAPIIDLKTHNQGLYAYIARIRPEQRTWQSKNTKEGKVEWQKISHVCDLGNPIVVSNIPYFLPHMLIAKKPHLYEIEYADKEIKGMRISVLSENFHPVKV